MAHVSEFKKKIVADLVKLSKEYPIIGIVNMENLPAPQLQSMKTELRGKVNLFMTKKTLMRIALDKIKEEKKGAEELTKYFDGMPAIIFTKDSPFKLSKILKKNKTSAPAKSGQTAPNDIIIPKGPTPFAPGPIISELSGIGLQVGVESGKVAVKEDSVVAKKGEMIKPKVAEVLLRLDIKPMEVGLDLVAAYESGIIYQKDILEVDEKQYLDNVNLAAVQAFNLAFEITYVTKDNVQPIISKAFNDAKALGLQQNIIDTGIIEDLLGKAERSILSLKNTAGIETLEKPKQEPVKEEAKPEEPVKEEKKEEEKPQAPKEKPQPKEEKPKEQITEVKKEVPKPEVKKQPEPEVKKEVAIKEQEPLKETIKEEVKPGVKEKQPEPIETKKEESIQEKIEEKPKPQPKPIEAKEEIQKIGEKKPEEEIDKKINRMVDQTKKFMRGEEETAEDILEEVKKEQTEEEKPEPEVKELKEEEVPSAHDLKKKKEEALSAHDLKKQKEEKEQKEVEDLAKELVTKGTLRKK